MVLTVQLIRRLETLTMGVAILSILAQQIRLTIPQLANAVVITAIASTLLVRLAFIVRRTPRHTQAAQVRRAQPMPTTHQQVVDVMRVMLPTGAFA